MDNIFAKRVKVDRYDIDAAQAILERGGLDLYLFNLPTFPRMSNSLILRLAMCNEDLSIFRFVYNKTRPIIHLRPAIECGNLSALYRVMDESDFIDCLEYTLEKWGDTVVVDRETVDLVYKYFGNGIIRDVFIENLEANSSPDIAEYAAAAF